MGLFDSLPSAKDNTPKGDGAATPGKADGGDGSGWSKSGSALKAPPRKSPVLLNPQMLKAGGLLRTSVRPTLNAGPVRLSIQREGNLCSERFEWLFAKTLLQGAGVRAARTAGQIGTPEGGGGRWR
jgi:hypothetical protein